MDSSFWLEYNKFGLVHCTLSRGVRLLIKKYCILLSEGLFLSFQTVKTQMKCSIMQHFIWDFIVCKRTCLQAIIFLFFVLSIILAKSQRRGRKKTKNEISFELLF